MRLEATIPDSRGSAVVELAAELGLSRSQLIDEALALFLQVVIEVRSGRRVVTLDLATERPACELVTPTLTALEWAMRRTTLRLPPKALTKMQEVANAPPKPGRALKAAAKRHRR